MLYPLKFKPIFKERIWGGRALLSTLNKKLPEGGKIGESWELSGIYDNLSIVSNGKLKDNTIEEMIEIFMGDLVGEHIYDEFGMDFPLLVKFIDANEALSIQVHPNDEIARERHDSYGKTEMWYIIDSKPGSHIYLGFNRDVTCAEYLEAAENGTITELLNKITVNPGDSFLIPAGTVHAIGGGILLAEIQQSSDVTYRIYDWGKVDESGNSRELHTEQALDVINYSKLEPVQNTPNVQINASATITKNEFFTANIFRVKGELNRDYSKLDSFVIYLNLGGEAIIGFNGGYESLTTGGTILIPAQEESITIRGDVTMIEIYIEK